MMAAAQAGDARGCASGCHHYAPTVASACARLGVNLEYRPTDWAMVLRSLANRGPAERGG